MALRIKFFTGPRHIKQIVKAFVKAGLTASAGIENVFVDVPEQLQEMTVAQAAEEILTLIEEDRGNTCGLDAVNAQFVT